MRRHARNEIDTIRKSDGAYGLATGIRTANWPDDDLGEEDTGEDSEVRREERMELRRILREHMMRVDGDRAEDAPEQWPPPCCRRLSSNAP